MSLFSRTTPVSTDEHKINELLTRGVAETIIGDSLKKKLMSGERLRVKLGIDPTSPDLHVGRSIPLLKLRDFQELGHTAVLIVGDFTAVIGDTSDKDAERPMLSNEIIEKNKKTYFEQVGKILDLSKTELRYNSEWLGKLTYRDIGEHADLFSVADFIARENIKRRLDAGKRVSLRELLYPLMQGYDSVAIKADVELGGTDQKFNVLAGRPLQEHFKQRPQDVLLTPLIDGLDGTKMSSSKGNVITLTAEPNDMYGKVMSMADAQIETYLKLCTRVPLADIPTIIALHPKEAKMRLAREMVAMYHSKDAAEKAEKNWQTTFSEGGVPEDIQELDSLGTLRDTLVKSGVVSSNSEFARLILGNAVKQINSQGEIKIIDAQAPAVPGKVYRIGKHRIVKIK